MNYYITERKPTERNMKNAANKARADVEHILSDLGYHSIEIDIPLKEKNNIISSTIQNINYCNIWSSSLEKLKNGDELIIQFPPRSHSVFFPNLIRKLRKTGVKVTILIHDLEKLRYVNSVNIGLKKKLRMKLEEKNMLGAADNIIAHNYKMIEYLISEGIEEKKIVSLDIFDYLMENPNTSDCINYSNEVIIAGNLDTEKVVYLKYINEIKDVIFNLYGVGFDERKVSENMNYYGSFLPDELPYKLKGGFGLVWDGISADTCTGMYGNYLRYNNPHKTSLYLASGFPVIVWKEAAIADFVLKNKVGITVESLYEINKVISSMSEEEYNEIYKNVSDISEKLRTGYYLKTSLGKR